MIPKTKHAGAGYRMPAEWEPHEATWLAWPHNASDWPGKFAAIPWVFGEMIRALAPGEAVRILVASASHETRARRVLSAVGLGERAVRFHRVRTDRSWIRDYGPAFVVRRRAPRLAVARFRFNAWARYRNFQRDDRVPAAVARRLRLPLLPVRANGRNVVLEGGAVDVNGRGSVLVSEQCLLAPGGLARNPGLDRAGYEAVLAAALGARRVLWLGRGIEGDDTHGHVDGFCRFVSERTIVLCREPNGADPNHAALEENRERLEGMRLENGARPDVVRLPMPAPLRFRGRRLPASYANFYIGNRAVLVPTFNDPNDRTALGLLAELFPDRTVTGIHAVDLVWGLGAVHCLSRQQPAC